MQQLVCAVVAETDLIMCAENRWPTLRLEMQLLMRDLGYPPGQSKSARVVNTALASTGKGVPRNREEAMQLLAKAASLGDDKA
jgi:TPR repeat protein